MGEEIVRVLSSAGLRSALTMNGEDALELAERERPDAIVLEIDLPGVSGYEVCWRLRQRWGGSLPIVFLSHDRTESRDRVAGLLLGADEYLAKPIAADELLARLRSLLRRLDRLAAPSQPELTPRESEILSLLARGLSQVEIAEQLVISSKTVSSHIERILKKLGVRSRAQAVAVSYQRQLAATASTLGPPGLWQDA